MSKTLSYSMQLAMLVNLLNRKLISEYEYKRTKEQLMKDYKIVSNIMN